MSSDLEYLQRVLPARTAVKKRMQISPERQALLFDNLEEVPPMAFVIEFSASSKFEEDPERWDGLS